MPKYNSYYLKSFVDEFTNAITKEEKNQIWQRVETPIIEDVPRCSKMFEDNHVGKLFS